MNHSQALIQDLRDALQDWATLCEHGAVEPEFFRTVVGPHLRHVLDHCDLLLQAVQAGADSPSVNYDARHRDPRTEQDRQHALHRLRRAALDLEQMADLPAATPVEISARSTVRTAPSPVRSSLGRELVFLHGHAIHHQAMIAIQARQAGIVLHPDFGKAPATVVQESRLGRR